MACDLHNVQQKEGETLKVHLACYNAAIVRVMDLDEKAFVSTFVKGLRSKHLMSNFNKDILSHLMRSEPDRNVTSMVKNQLQSKGIRRMKSKMRVGWSDNLGVTTWPLSRQFEAEDIGVAV